MTPPAPTLAQLPLPFYTDGSGPVAPDRKGAIALDAIFDATGNAQYIGYSQNVRLSLLQHFVHFPHQCDGYKAIALDVPVALG